MINAKFGSNSTSKYVLLINCLLFFLMVKYLLPRHVGFLFQGQYCLVVHCRITDACFIQYCFFFVSGMFFKEQACCVVTASTDWPASASIYDSSFLFLFLKVEGFISHDSFSHFGTLRNLFFFYHRLIHIKKSHCLIYATSFE